MVSAALRDGASPADVRALLGLAEQLLPIHDIHIHLSNDLPVEDVTTTGQISNPWRFAFSLRSPEDEEQQARLLDTLHLIEPFNRSPEKARDIGNAI